MGPGQGLVDQYTALRGDDEVQLYPGLEVLDGLDDLSEYWDSNHNREIYTEMGYLGTFPDASGQG